MGRRGRSINRVRNPRFEKSRMLVVTEGEVTEVQYLQGLAQQLRASGASIRGVRAKGIGRDPLKVVQMALAMAEGEEFDEVWVVVDVDDHTTLEEAIHLGTAEKIPVVVSNPCFEIWLLWHYGDCRAAQSRADLKRRLEGFGHDGKNVPSSFPYRSWQAAATRCAHNSVAPSQVGTNPSSAMPDVVAAMRRPLT